MINPHDLKMYVVRPTLEQLGMYSESAEKLLLGTFAQESHMGYWLKQKGGPALGIGQMEPATHCDCWRYLTAYKDLPRKLRKQRKELLEKVAQVTGFKKMVSHETLIWNLQYAVVMTRIKYWMVPEAIPDTVEGMAEYWKRYYNSHYGRGTVEEFVENYHRFIN